MGVRTYIFALCALLVVGFGAGALLLAPAGEVHVAAVTPAPLPADAPEPEVQAAVLAPIDVPEIEGYSGTLEARQPEALTQSRAKALPARAGRDSSADELQRQARALASAADYSASLRAMWELSGRIDKEYHPGAGVSTNYDILVTRFEREPIHLRDILFKAFEESSGVARQTLIFHIALALPESTAFPWLRKLTQLSDAADAADATCALAFRGDGEAMSAFETMPAARVNCRRIVDTADQHDALAAAGEREYLRSYRCIEVMDCRPYFLRHPWAFKRGASEQFQGMYRVVSFPWADRLRDTERNVIERRAARLLPAWIAHFRGHPGTDDMAWRLCRYHSKGENWVEAAAWASRCATFPDQDMSDCGVQDLITIAERRLSDGQIDDLLAGEDFERNRQLLQYIRLRRAAAQCGFENALADAAFIAASEPDGFLAKCFRARWGEVVPYGLDSGVAALPADDPLRVVARDADSTPPAWSTNYDWQTASNRKIRHPGDHENEGRLYPPPEAVRMKGMLVARQFRAWETIAELERRRDRRHGDERADLEYKIGAVYFHDRNVLYPCYTVHHYRNALPAGVEASWSWGDKPSQQEVAQHLELRKEFSSMARAADIFGRVADENFTWPGRDKALFSAGLARIKLVDYRPFPKLSNVDIVAGASLFERVVQEHPDSTLADDAANAAKYWRRNFRDAFAPSGIVSRD